MVELMVEPMPKVVKPLTELEVKNLKPRVMPDGTLKLNKVLVGGCPNLYVYVKPSGTKSWVLRPKLFDTRPVCLVHSERVGIYR